MADAWVLKGSVRGPQGEQGEPGQSGSPGAQGAPGVAGQDGAPAGFGTPTATVDSTTGTPGVDVIATGPDTAKVFSFAFTGLKGETGAQGPQGPAGQDGAQGPQGEQGPQGPAGADGSDATVTAGNGVSVSGGQVSVKLAASSGMTSTSAGLALDFPTDEELLEYLGLS